MSKRGQNTTSNDGSPTAKARPINLVMHSLCNEEISSRSAESLVNPVNDDDRRSAGAASGNCGSFDSNFEVGYSQVSRQEKVTQAPQETWASRTKPKQKVRRTLLAQGNLMHHYQNSSTWNSQVIDTWQRSSNAYRRNWEGLHLLRSQGSIQDKCIDTRNVHGVVDESSHLSWAGYPQEFEHLQKHKIREH